MKVGDLVRVPSWQENRTFWKDHRPFGIGVIFAMTTHRVHVRWSNGRYFKYKMRTAKCLEVVA